MEATLPISAAVKSAPTEVARANANAPSVTLPLSFTATGLLALAAGILWLIIQPGLLAAYHYSPGAVAMTHLVVLGWILSIVMGAMYQLVPVALETRLYSERLARWQFVVHVVGFVGMVWMFRAWNMKQVGHFGSVFALGLGLFVYNIVRTLLRIPRWNVVAFAVASALFWILFAATAGLSLAATKCVYGTEETLSATGALGTLLGGLQAVAAFTIRFAPLSAMHAHAHLGVAGFFLMLIVGVSYKLVPMFTLSEIQSHVRAISSVALLSLGLAGSFLAILLQSRWKPVCALLLVSALALYGWELAAILRARKRSVLDWGLRYFLTGVCLLAPLSVIGLYLSRPGLALTEASGQLENVYGFLALMGVVSFALIGMLYKIVPFVVWYGAYSRHIGRARVPALAEMYSARLQAASYFSMLAGLLGTTLAMVRQSPFGVRCGGVFLAAGFAALAVNMSVILGHYFRPRLSPLSKPFVNPSPL